MKQPNVSWVIIPPVFYKWFVVKGQNKKQKNDRINRVRMQKTDKKKEEFETRKSRNERNKAAES